MRTETTLIQGNQAFYDANGVIITNTIVAGIADRYAPYDDCGWARPSFKHRDYDVYPFLRAIQLDGNPCSVNLMNEISRPCLYQGSYLDEYLKYRPIIKPE